MDIKKRIVEESLKLFLNHGVKAVTVERISKHIRISKRTFYEHFENKMQLLKNCLIAYEALMRKEHERIMKTTRNNMEALFRWNDALMTRMDLVNPNFYTDIEHYYPGLMESFHKENGDFIHDTIIELAKGGIKDGMLRKGIHVEIFAKTVLSLLKLFKDSEMFPPMDYSKIQLTFNILGPYIKGVSTEAGLNMIKKYEERMKLMYAGYGFQDLEGEKF